MQMDFLTANVFRQKVIQATRDFFDQQGFQEFLIPVLNKSVPMFPTVYPFLTKWEPTAQSIDLFLPIFPEKAMKKYLALGAEKPYAIGHCFRNLEDSGLTHHPEFLMLEWYRTDCNYEKIMEDTKQLCEYVCKKINKTNEKKGLITNEKTVKEIMKSEWKTLSIEDLWQEKFQMSVKEVMTLPEVTKLAQKLNYQTENATWEQLFNQIYLNEIESEFPQEPFFLIDFPAQMSPLCKPRADKPWLAERFELYIQQIEVGNGNSEQLDAKAVQQYFTAEVLERQAQGLEKQPIDEDFLQSLETMEKSGKDFAGMGFGIDRLAMILGGMESIAQIWEPLK